jgi:hypothetical protein
MKVLDYLNKGWSMYKRIGVGKKGGRADIQRFE